MKRLDITFSIKNEFTLAGSISFNDNRLYTFSFQPNEASITTLDGTQLTTVEYETLVRQLQAWASFHFNRCYMWV